jgi:hypothetical protein
MKKGLLFFGIAICIAAVATQVCTASGHPFKAFLDAAFNWEKTEHDFGTIKKDVPVDHRFTFTNKGNAPLIITSVQASCGCTVTDYSTDPIAPGESGFVKATYNAAKVGVFSKTVTVNANTADGAVLLAIKGIVRE